MDTENNRQAVTTQDQQQQNKSGRPSKYDAETVDRLLNALGDGLNIKQSCRAAGIGETTLARWREKHPEIAPLLMKAREQARQKALAGIKSAGESGDWRAWAKFLEMSYPEYRQPNTKVEVRTAAQAGEVQVICNEATRQAMIQAREKLLRDGPKRLPQPEQPRSEPGHIGGTKGLGDEKQPGMGQAIAQPGATFNLGWESMGIDMEAWEAELHGCYLVREQDSNE
jgi:transposase-like protein